MANDRITIFGDSAKNTAIAAAAKEAIVSSNADIRKYAPFNELIVDNGDVVDIEIYLDGIETGVHRRIVRAESVFGLTPEDGLFFSSIVQKNLHASTAETANAILFMWSRKDKV